MFVKPPPFLVRSTPRLTWNFPGDKQEVYLTFDDGPTPEVTSWVLNQLHQFDAKATFFCLGKNVEHYPDLYEHIIKAGHSVGNHGHNHLKGFRHSAHVYLDDINLAGSKIDSVLFRPPYGRILPAQVKVISDHYRIIMWSVLSVDYNQRLDCKRVLHNVIDNVKPGSIIVFHDSEKASKNLYYALPRTLEFLKEQGYKMKSIV